MGGNIVYHISKGFVSCRNRCFHVGTDASHVGAHRYRYYTHRKALFQVCFMSVAHRYRCGNGYIYMSVVWPFMSGHIGFDVFDISVFMSVNDLFMSVPKHRNTGLHVGPHAIHVGRHGTDM